MSDQEKANEIEIFNHKREFIIKMTNRVILSMFVASIGITWGVGYFFGGMKTQVNDHERRITTMEGIFNQGAKNAIRAEYNKNVPVK